MAKFNFLTITILLTAILGLSSCGSSKKNNGDGSSIESSDSGTDLGGSDQRSDFALNSDSDSGKAGPLQTIVFGFNSSSLSSSAQDALNSNAEFLKSNSSVEVQIEGHCDERGGIQFNLALGENRAKTVRDYLVAQGVASRQVSTISFGKERPVAFGHDEGSWGRNRRANFVVTAK